MTSLTLVIRAAFSFLQCMSHFGCIQLLIGCFYCAAQSPELDKAFRVPAAFQESPTQLDSLLALGPVKGRAEHKRLYLISRLYRETDPNKALEFAKSSIEKIEKTDDFFALQRLYVVYGHSLSVQGNFPAAQRCLTKAQSILDNLHDSLSLADKYILQAYNATYAAADEFQVKTSNLEKSYELYKALRDNEGMGHTTYGMAGDYYYKVYNNPSIPTKKVLLEKAMEYGVKAERFFFLANMKDRRAGSIFMQGQIYDLMGKPERAKSLLRAAYLIHKKEKGYLGMQWCAWGTAKVLVNQGKFDSAIFFMQQSAALLEKVNVNYDLSENYDFQTSIYKSLKNFPAALKTSELARSYREKSFTVNHLSEVANIKNSYENQLKDERISDLETEKKLQASVVRQQRTIAISAFSIFSLVIGLGSYAYFQRQKSINQMKKNIQLGSLLQRNLEGTLQDTQLAALKAQMDPHFIGNAINSVQNLILQEKKEEALVYLNDFSRLTRYALENSKKETITLSEEVEFLKHYIHLEQLRYPAKFDFDIHLDSSIDDPGFERIPPMMVQPFVENAIRHGIHHKIGTGFVKVSFYMIDNTLTATIEDDGVGRKAAAQFEQQRQSHSTAITDARLELLQKKADLQHRYKIQIEDLFNPDATPRGTKVTILIPTFASMQNDIAKK